MQKVTYTKAFEGKKKGYSEEVTDRQAQILIKGGVAEKYKKEDKAEKTTKENKDSKTTK